MESIAMQESESLPKAGASDFEEIAGLLKNGTVLRIGYEVKSGRDRS